MRTNREAQLLAPCQSEGPSSLRQDQGDGDPNDLIRGSMLTMVSVGRSVGCHSGRDWYPCRDSCLAFCYHLRLPNPLPDDNS